MFNMLNKHLHAGTHTGSAGSTRAASTSSAGAATASSESTGAFLGSGSALTTAGHFYI